MLLMSAAIGAVFIAIAAVAAAIHFRRKKHIDLFRRMRYYTDKTRVRENKMPISRTQTFLMETLQNMAGPFQRLHVFDGLERKLRQAGLPLLGAEFALMVLFAAVTAGLIAALLLNNTLFGVILGAVIIMSSGMLLTYLIHQRRKAFVNQLSNCLTMVASALRAGYSFMQAMDLVAKSMKPPINEEFDQVMRDVATGVLLEQALRDMDERMESPDFTLVVTAVLIQREVGGNLAQVLDSISETINERIRMRREILSLTAQGRMSAWILLLMPFAIAGMVTLINENYLVPLVESDIGRFAIITAIVLEIFGYIVIQRIIDIEF